MNKNFNLANPKILCSVVCSIVMLAILVLMFVPFWSYEGTNEETFEPESRITSINGYLWFPSDHNELEDVFNEPLANVPDAEDIDANTIALPIGMQILFGAFGIVLCIWKAKVTFTAVLPIVCGLFGIYGYAFVSALRMGTPAVWIASLVLSVIAVILGVVRIILGYKIKETVERLRKA